MIKKYTVEPTLLCTFTIHYSLFTSLCSQSASAHAQRGSQCRQHRNDDLYHRLPKLLVLHKDSPPSPPCFREGCKYLGVLLF